MKSKFNFLYEARTFLVLWLTQSFSALGSAMTGYALVIWSYQQKGSALATSLLMVCSAKYFCRCVKRQVGQKENHAWV